MRLVEVNNLCSITRTRRIARVENEYVRKICRVRRSLIRHVDEAFEMVQPF